jgi:hypothetical protein
LHHTGPPLALSRDLLIRALANQLQERSYSGVSRALRRRLQSLAGAADNGTMAVDPGLVLKAGTTLVRRWRGHTHTVLVRKDGFEHEGQRYRSLTAVHAISVRPAGDRFRHDGRAGSGNLPPLTLPAGSVSCSTSRHLETCTFVERKRFLYIVASATVCSAGARNYHSSESGSIPNTSSGTAVNLYRRLLSRLKATFNLSGRVLYD